MATSIYTIQISNPATPIPGDGFVDPNNILNYLPGTNPDPSDFTYVLSQAKKKANLRFKQIILEFGRMAQVDVSMSTILVPSSSYKTEPTSITFTIFLQFGDNSLVTWDELNPGQTLSGNAALIRTISRGLVWSATVNADVYDPTPLATIGNSTLLPRYGYRTLPLIVGPVSTTLLTAASLITVTPIVQH